MTQEQFAWLSFAGLGTGGYLAYANGRISLDWLFIAGIVLGLFFGQFCNPAQEETPPQIEPWQAIALSILVSITVWQYAGLFWLYPTFILCALWVGTLFKSASREYDLQTETSEESPLTPQTTAQ